mmetsp:Transcript_32944/g.38268  ORF Transcript_32944/g.38268 Transcript_32944/m.38268 type:complete len:87 (-) Transcript_32944:1569-1829(-)
MCESVGMLTFGILQSTDFMPTNEYVLYYSFGGILFFTLLPPLNSASFTSRAHPHDESLSPSIQMCHGVDEVCTYASSAYVVVSGYS